MAGHFHAVEFLLRKLKYMPQKYNPLGPTNTLVESFSNRDATIIDSLIEGEVEYAAPSHACAPIAHPFFVPDSNRKNIVLINGTAQCDFMTKVRNARASGFEAAILFDPFPEPFNYSDITFPIERSEINITVVLVSCKDGMKLQNYLFPESRKTNTFVQILSTSSYQIQMYVIYAGIVYGAAVAVVVILLSVLVIRNKLKKYRNRVPRRINWNLYKPMSGESESAGLLASESSTPNNCQSSTEKLKNELVEALGSVNDVQGSELKRENTKAVIV